MKENNEYKELPTPWGERLDTVVNYLIAKNLSGEKVCVKFNDVMLYSDKVTMDSAYLAVTGKTKKECEEANENWRKEYERKEAEHKANIPKLIPLYIEKGHKILKEKYWELWDKCVPARLDDLYNGMELDCSLEIIKILQDENDFEKAKEVFYNHGHSYMSGCSTARLIYNLCDNGKEFVDMLDL